MVTVDQPQYNQSLQNQVDLSCHVLAYPLPSVIWLKDGYQLNDNQFYRLASISIADDIKNTTLGILATEKKPYGKYTCKATNKLGSAENTVELYGM